MQSVDFKKYADLMNEKFFQLAEPEQLEEYLFTACDQTAVLYHAELATALARLPEQTQEEIFRYYFLRQPQRVIGVHIGRTRSTAGRHKIRYLLDRQCSIIKSTTIKIMEENMKKKYSTLPESMKKMEMYGFNWMEFVISVPSPLYIMTSYKSNGQPNACMQSMDNIYGGKKWLLCNCFRCQQIWTFISNNS